MLNLFRTFDYHAIIGVVTGIVKACLVNAAINHAAVIYHKSGYLNIALPDAAVVATIIITVNMIC